MFEILDLKLIYVNALSTQLHHKCILNTLLYPRLNVMLHRNSLSKH